MILAAFVAVLAQSASNAIFAYELGGVFVATVYGVRIAVDGAVLAAGSVALAVFQAHTATALQREPVARRNPVAWVLLIGCMCYSLGAMSSHVLKLQRHQNKDIAVARQAYDAAAGNQRAAFEAYQTAKRAHDASVADLQRATAVRSVAEIQAEISSVRINPRAWRDTDQCSKFPTAWHKQKCDPILDLYRERAAAASRTDRGADAAHARKRLDAAREKLAAANDGLRRAVKPEARWHAEMVLAQLLPWIVAIALELIGTFGFGFAGGKREPAKVTRRDEPRPAKPAKVDAPAGADELHALLIGLQTGTVRAPECTTADGWLIAPQDVLARLLGVTGATISRKLKKLEQQGVIAVRKVGRATRIRVECPELANQPVSA